MFHKDAGNVYRVEPWTQFDWLNHWFGTRNSPELPNEPNLATVRQIHSNVCLNADGQQGRIGEGDALVTITRGQFVAVRTADCLPILIADERLHAVAAVHAGWRGTVAGVAVAAVREMTTRFGSRPEDLHVAIGPGIGACCYEVGPEVAAEFRAIFSEEELSGASQRVRGDPRGPGGPPHNSCKIDLAEANRRLLAAAGVSSDRILAGAPCTFCTPGEFYSYRREQEQTGRMLSVIGIVA